MTTENQFSKIANKLAHIEDKFMEIQSIIKIINIWVKDKDYELIPIINMLNDKMDEIEKVFKY